MLETGVQSKIIKYLEKRGFFVVKVVSANTSGIPDLICCTLDGRFFAIEVKQETGKVTDLQALKLQWIASNNGIVMVAFGFEDFLTKFALLFPEFL